MSKNRVKMYRFFLASFLIFLATSPSPAKQRKDNELLRNFCQPGGYTAGAEQQIPKEKWKFNWGRGAFGCNNLVCQRCREPVEWSLSKEKRTYRCSCSSFSYHQLDCFGQERCEGPMYFSVERPNWTCAGHPLRPDKTKSPPLPATFPELDEIYNTARGTAFAQQTALHVSTLASVHRDLCARFYFHNPKAPGREVMLALEPGPDPVAWCRALAANTDDPRFKERLRELALIPNLSRHATAQMAHDREWLRPRIEQLLSLEPANGEKLFEFLCRPNLEWDQDALKTLPLNLLRYGVLQLSQSHEALEYWRRDYHWLVENYASFQQKDSSFGLYLQDFLVAKGWQPDNPTIEVWRLQALQINNCWSVIPNLVKWDQAWVEDNLEAILDNTTIRGAWIVGLLHQGGSQRVPELLEIVRARTPNDCTLSNY